MTIRRTLARAIITALSVAVFLAWYALKPVGKLVKWLERE